MEYIRRAKRFTERDISKETKDSIPKIYQKMKKIHIKQYINWGERFKSSNISRHPKDSI